MLERMVDVQRHRGPDDRGTRSFGTGHPDVRVGLGHDRLSILDLSPAGRQPMSDPSGRRWVVLNGEIYNYRELRHELGGPGAFRTGTDTEVLLAAYGAWGLDCLERLNGMFAFALWDADRELLFCARDRLGIKPFHYAWHGDRFLFASEPKALFAAGVEPEPDLESWTTYLWHGHYDHDTRTFFAPVSSLAPAHCLTLRVAGRWGGRGGPAGSEEVRCYWSLPDRVRGQEKGSVAPGTSPGSLDDAAERWMSLLDDSVRLRRRADVAVGVNLSGGLDSAALMATVDRQLEPGQSVESFTAAFDDPRYDESGFAGAVPARAAWRRSVERIGWERAWSSFAEAMQHQEAPIGGVATLGYHALHGVARDRDVTVLLEGQGVDELLAGYAYVRPHRYLDLLERHGAAVAAREAEAFGDETGDALAGARAIAQGADVPVYQDGSRHLRPECVGEALRDRAGAREGPAFPQPFADRLDNVLYRDLRYTKLPRVLRMNDRLSMAFGRELREPYLDHRLVELSFSLPAEFKLGGGSSKRLLRHGARDRLPASVLSVAKRAVVTPQREWLRGPGAHEVLECLASRAVRESGFLDVARAKRAFERFREGDGDNSFFVWQWLNVSAWLEYAAGQRRGVTV